jgi:hypothetical protein
MPRGNGNKPVLLGSAASSWGVASADKVEFLPSQPSLSSLAGRVEKLREELWSSINALANHADEIFGHQIQASDPEKDTANKAGVLAALDREISMLEAALPRLAREVGRFAGHA